MEKVLKSITAICLLIFMHSFCHAQDDWQQKLDGWIDDQYQPFLFLGGDYFTKVSFADIDGDGDYDMFMGGGGRGSFRLFENYGDQYEPKFRLKDIVHPGFMFDSKALTVDAEFGDLDYDNDLDAIVNINCDPLGSIISGRFINSGNSYIPLWGLPPENEQRIIFSQGPVSLIDIDQDGDLDIISGMQDSTIHLCIRSSDSIPYFSLTEEHLGHMYIGSMFFTDVIDLDSDGDYDLVACVTRGINKYYENIGGPGIDSLHWVLADSNFLGGQYTPDWLECPEFVDIDADGDLDLFLSGAYGHLNYFENTGNTQFPQFEHKYDTSYVYRFPVNMREAQFVDIDGDNDQDIACRSLLMRNIGPIYDPHWQLETNALPNNGEREFCDIDADGDYDIIVPTDYGVMLVPNLGTPQEASWGSGEYIIHDSHSYIVFTAIPVDVDGDSDYDLVIGSWTSSDLILYENTGDPQNYEFEYATDNYVGFSRAGETEFDPVFADLDIDGDLDLLISYKTSGYNRSELHYYENLGSNITAEWEFVTDDFMGWFSSGMVNHAYLDCGDYDADGDPDILMSCDAGLMLFLNQAIQVAIEENPDQNVDATIKGVDDVLVYPNPSNSSISFKLASLPNADIRIDIYNILGQKIDSLIVANNNIGTNIAEWNSGDYPSGFYFYRMSFSNKIIGGRFVLIK